MNKHLRNLASKLKQLPHPQKKRGYYNNIINKKNFTPGNYLLIKVHNLQTNYLILFNNNCWQSKVTQQKVKEHISLHSLNFIYRLMAIMSRILHNSVK